MSKDDNKFSLPDLNKGGQYSVFSHHYMYVPLCIRGRYRLEGLCMGKPRRQCSRLTLNYSYLCEAEEQPQSAGGIESVVDLVLDGCLAGGTGALFAPLDVVALDALSGAVVSTAPKELLGLQLRRVVSVIPALKVTRAHFERLLRHTQGWGRSF